MEKLTPTRFSQVKTISGNNETGSYSFQSIGFLTKEYGDKKWFNLAFKGENPLKEGQTYELEVKQRPYKDKDGNDKVSFNVSFPDKFSELSKAVMNTNVEMGKLRARVEALEARLKPTPAQMSEPPEDTEYLNAELAGQDLPLIPTINAEDLPF